MKKRTQNIFIMITFITFIAFFLVLFLVLPVTKESLSERRKLTQMPEVSTQSISSGSFMENFEKYGADQFPFREQFRRIYAYISLYVFGKKDINDIYVVNGYAAKLEPEIEMESVEWSINRINYICDTLAINSPKYFAIIPDKNAYLAHENGYPYLEQNDFYHLFQQAFEARGTWIDLKESLSLEDYYRTDPHWSQENIQGIAVLLLGFMNSSIQSSNDGNSIRETKAQKVNAPFYGTYYGQSSLALEPDEIKYLTNDVINHAKVTCFDTGTPVKMSVYDLEKAYGRDPYEMFLGGAKSLITMENTVNSNGRQLILFRDSFGSSLAPLLLSPYEKITLVDIRYISPQVIEKYVDFEHADVLFLYSTQVLNHSKGQFLN